MSCLLTFKTIALHNYETDFGRKAKRSPGIS